MGVYLLDHPPRHQQFRCPRRERPSGVIGVHTAESFPDETGPDTGAENVARFIRDRTNYGSYHLLADSDSIIQLIEFRCVAYHIATHGLNEHSIGVSAATQAHRWGSLDDFWVKACVTNMARASALAASWLQREHGITVPARRITLTQARNKTPGFIAHADADPDRRTDPGASFPWEMFLNTYAELMEDDMPTAAGVAKALLDTRVENRVTGDTIKIRDLLPFMHEDGVQVNARQPRIETRVVALQALVAEMVERDPSTPLTGAEVKAIVEQAIVENIVKVDVTIAGQGPAEP